MMQRLMHSNNITTMGEDACCLGNHELMGTSRKLNRYGILLDKYIISYHAYGDE